MSISAIIRSSVQLSPKRIWRAQRGTPWAKIVRTPKQIRDAIRRQRGKLGPQPDQRQGQDKATAGNHLGGREWCARDSARNALRHSCSARPRVRYPSQDEGKVGRDRGHLLVARPRRHIPLNVILNNRLFGRLNRQPSRAIDFRYDPSWLAWEHALPCRYLYLCART